MIYLTRPLREPGGPCTESMEVLESRMERVNARESKQNKINHKDFCVSFFLSLLLTLSS